MASRRGVLSLLVLTLLTLTATTARADVAVAREHFRKGKVLFDLQRYLEAAKEYEAAYEAKDDPALLFNIGQAYRLGGDMQKALGAYRSYLRNLPSAPNQAEVHTRIDELQQQIEEQRHAASQATVTQQPTPVEPAPVTPPPRTVEVTPPPPIVVAPTNDRRARTERIAGIAVIAFGVAALAAGVALEVVASQDNDQLSHPKKGAIFDPSLNSAIKNDSAAGVSLLIVGGVAAATGATLLALGYRHRHAPSAMLTPTLAPGLAALTVSGRF
jgi:tetratricopeptide (TPR) repeat protein